MPTHKFKTKPVKNTKKALSWRLIINSITMGVRFFYRGGAETWVPVILGAGGIPYSLLTDYKLGAQVAGVGY